MAIGFIAIGGILTGLIQWNSHTSKTTKGANLATVEVPGIDTRQLINALEQADDSMRPTVTVRSDGSTRYNYRQRADEPTPSLEELEDLVKNPKNFQVFHDEILLLLKELKSIGVAVAIEPMENPAIAGTWLPQKKLVRINAKEIGNGSVAFHETLAHEAIHVAQSCNAGSTTSIPSRIGLTIKYSPSIDNSVYHPIYSSNPEEGRLIEREAYSNSKEPGIASSLVQRYCRGMLIQASIKNVRNIPSQLALPKRGRYIGLPVASHEPSTYRPCNSKCCGSGSAVSHPSSCADPRRMMGNLA
jgi:hypothetical protein